MPSARIRGGLQREIAMLDLVLIPGMVCDAKLFAAQMAAFGRPVAIPDLARVEGATLEDIAHALLAMLPERFALGGPIVRWQPCARDDEDRARPRRALDADVLYRHTRYQPPLRLAGDRTSARRAL